MGTNRRRGIGAALAIAVALVAPAAAHAFDPALEAKNFAKTTERLTVRDADARVPAAARSRPTPRTWPMWRRSSRPTRSATSPATSAPTAARSAPATSASTTGRRTGMGMVEPVLFTARNGSTLSGHVWASAEGPKKRPLVVITNGSVQAPEHLYWGQAATLAKHGYVVLTYDPQGQGLSDTFGAGVDCARRRPLAGGPPVLRQHRGRARLRPLDPGRSLRPAPELHERHRPLRRSRTAASKEGFERRLQPALRPGRPRRVGIAGHSLGAAAVSYVGQIDPRVDAIVAWDNLGAPERRHLRRAQSALPAPSPRPDQPADHQAGDGDHQRLRDRRRRR